MTEKDKWMNMALHDLETAEYKVKEALEEGILIDES